MNMDGGTETLRSAGLAIVATGVAITGLVLGSSFLIPLAISILLWNLLEALIKLFERISIGSVHIPRSVAMVLGITVVVITLYLVVSVLFGQADAIKEAWPRYVSRLEGMIGELSQWLGPVASGKVSTLLQEINLVRRIPTLLFSAQSFMVSLVLVIAYVGFLLGEERYLAPKVAAMSQSKEQAVKTAQLLNDISESIRRYIWMKTLVSLLTGSVSYAILRAIGVDFAETWAMLIFILNFIPTVGTILATLLVSLYGLLQLGDFKSFLILLTAVGLIQFFVGNVLQPRMSAKTLNLSQFVVILSLFIWGALWGVVGMFLAVPITAILMIVLANFPSTRVVAAILSETGELRSAGDAAKADTPAP